MVRTCLRGSKQARALAHRNCTDVPAYAPAPAEVTITSTAYTVVLDDSVLRQNGVAAHAPLYRRAVHRVVPRPSC